MKNFILLTIALYVFQTVSGQSITMSMLRLPDTGVNKSYTDTFGEDADYMIHPPYFSDNANGTVTDTVTGLMWQQTDGGEMTYENAITYCDTLTLGGYTDWRLPNAHEAYSIMNLQNSKPALDATAFTKTLAEYWWTSDKQANDNSKIWVTNAGGGIGNHLKTETISAGGTKYYNVRAVRSTVPPQTISGRYTDNGNGTVTDNLTELVWQQTPNPDAINWEDALVYAENLSLGGKDDWRMPNIKEIQSINDESLINPSVDQKFFPEIGIKKYWSSTSLPNQTTKAWYLYTQFGITTYDTKTLENYLICVRGNTGNTTGISDISDSGMPIAFPNPFNSFINVKYASNDAVFELCDMVGLIKFRGKFTNVNDFSDLPSGIYLLKIFDKTNSVIKLVKE